MILKGSSVYYEKLLINEGVTESVLEKSNILFDNSWLKDRELFSEVFEVFQYFKRNGYQIGIISDTSPLLPLTLEVLGL